MTLEELSNSSYEVRERLFLSILCLAGSNLFFLSFFLFFLRTQGTREFGVSFVLVKAGRDSFLSIHWLNCNDFWPLENCHFLFVSGSLLPVVFRDELTWEDTVCQCGIFRDCYWRSEQNVDNALPVGLGLNSSLFFTMSGTDKLFRHGLEQEVDSVSLWLDAQKPLVFRSIHPCSQSYHCIIS